jgi:hypothetical protein
MGRSGRYAVFDHLSVILFHDSFSSFISIESESA